MPAKNKFETSVWNEITPETERDIMNDCILWAKPQQIDFFIALKFIGIEPRAYDQDNAFELFCAARTIHFHLCKLDGKNYAATQHTTIRDLANAYSYANGHGNKRHND